MAMMLGKKIGMTQVYDDKGVIIPVTVIQAGPCTIMQLKDEQSDGYTAVQLGFGAVKPIRQKKPQIGHAKKAGAAVKRFLHEMRLDAPAEQQLGQELNVSVFEGIQFVDVIGTSKGKGFAGVVKRHGFKGQCASHGVERKHRSPGGIGANSGGRGTSRSIRKGKKMPGHMGHERCTTRNHRLIRIDPEKNLLLVKGPVPGPNNGFVIVAKAKTKG